MRLCVMTALKNLLDLPHIHNASFVHLSLSLLINSFVDDEHFTVNYSAYSVTSLMHAILKVGNT